MVKLIGVFLIVSSVVSLMLGSIIGINYGTGTQLTGNMISNIVEQPLVHLGFYDYLEAIIFSYSIISLIIGMVFLIMV